MSNEGSKKKRRTLGGSLGVLLGGAVALVVGTATDFTPGVTDLAFVVLVVAGAFVGDRVELFVVRERDDRGRG